MKEFLKKLNNILEENDPLIDFIAKIVLAIITISIAINANNIANKQTELEEINIIPNISIEDVIPEFGGHIIKVYNHGGPVYNLQSNAYSILNIEYHDGTEILRIPITLYLKRETGNQTGLILEYKEYVHSEADDLEEYINRRFQEENLKYKVNVRDITYIKISYEDKIKNKTTKFFLENTLLQKQTIEKVENVYANTEPKDLIQSSFEEFYQMVYEKVENN